MSNDGYNDLVPRSEAERLGQRIYMQALAGRRGFRDDQLGIMDTEIWHEIFEDIGMAAQKEMRDD